MTMSTLNAGEGAQGLQKIFGGVGCPVMSPQTFNLIQETIVGPNLDRLAEESCRNATDYEIYRVSGQRHGAGPRPITCVEFSQDGFYSKRSFHDRNYTSHAGGKLHFKKLKFYLEPLDN